MDSTSDTTVTGRLNPAIIRVIKTQLKYKYISHIYTIGFPALGNIFASVRPHSGPMVKQYTRISHT